MSYWLEHEVNGVALVLTDGHVGISKQHDLSEPHVIAALKRAQWLLPAIDAFYRNKSNAWDYERQCIAWSRVAMDDLSAFVEALLQVCDRSDSARFPDDLPAYIQEAAPEAYEILASRRAGERQKEAHMAKRMERQAGFVYLLRSASGYYKIGRTKNPDNRIMTFSVQLPFEVEFEHLIKTGDMRQLESALQAQFAEKRVRGEWFDLAPEDIAYIKSMECDA